MIDKVDLLYVFRYDDAHIQNAIKRLRCSIQSVQKQSIIPNIIVADYSDRSIRDELRDIRNITYKYNVVQMPQFNKSLLINHAVRKFVTTEYFFFSDIDLVYPPDYIQRMLAQIDSRKRIVRVVPYNYNIYEERYTFDYYLLLTLKKSNGGLAHGNGLIHLPSFKRIRGYNEKLIGHGPEDDEFNQRIAKINDLIYDTDIVTTHLYHEELNRIQCELNSKIYHTVVDKIIPMQHVGEEDISANLDQSYWGSFSVIEESWCNLPEHERNMQYWYRDKGDDELRINYPLNSNSIVFDVGGYEGTWSHKIHDKYKCNLYIFEPIKEFYCKIVECFCNNQSIAIDDKMIQYFQDNKNQNMDIISLKAKFYDYIMRSLYANKIQIYNFGLDDINKKGILYLNHDSTSAYSTINNTGEIEVELREFMGVVRELGISKIDLLKLNVEGAEYNILNNILKNNLITSIDNLQIQFHNFNNNMDASRNDIRNELQKTHYLTWEYDWIWENWRKR